MWKKNSSLSGTHARTETAVHIAWTKGDPMLAQEYFCNLYWQKIRMLTLVKAFKIQYIPQLLQMAHE